MVNLVLQRPRLEAFSLHDRHIPEGIEAPNHYTNCALHIAGVVWQAETAFPGCLVSLGDQHLRIQEDYEPPVGYGLAMARAINRNHAEKLSYLRRGDSSTAGVAVHRFHKLSHAGFGALIRDLRLFADGLQPRIGKEKYLADSHGYRTGASRGRSESSTPSSLAACFSSASSSSARTSEGTSASRTMT